MSTQAEGLGGRRYGLCDNCQLRLWEAGKGDPSRDNKLAALRDTGREGGGHQAAVRQAISEPSVSMVVEEQGLSSRKPEFCEAAPSHQNQADTV